MFLTFFNYAKSALVTLSTPLLPYTKAPVLNLINLINFVMPVKQYFDTEKYFREHPVTNPTYAMLAKASCAIPLATACLPCFPLSPIVTGVSLVLANPIFTRLATQETARARD